MGVVGQGRVGVGQGHVPIPECHTRCSANALEEHCLCLKSSW